MLQFKKHLDRPAIKQAAKELRRMDRAQAVRLMEGIPKEWEVKADALDALRDLVVRRAAYVADTIEGQLWPQKEFDFDNAGETEQ